ncbi:endonuclease MutS2 [Phormidium sp. CCY1219]|uniref:endonuclease MutS2 n=1 Tax=Phormidium sp. CCY1219 TaxID=2886104 RepID=UPI002D1EBED2|nr:endonuclease MutS2 [Phormidium sp. CCY1219]MEB3830454.1 endonuclease MutS2 [Phormidium sp. CCY1219]
MIQSETLELLEWPRLCEHLATFAGTKLGAMAAETLPIPESLEQTRELLSQTQELYELENRLLGGLSFEGIQDIGDSLDRANLQGILSGEELLAIATTLSGARQLRRTIDAHADLSALNGLIEDLRTYPEIEQEIHHCIDERGKVADRASVELGNIRARMRHNRDQIYQRLQSIMQRQGNAVQEQLITQRGDRYVIPVKAPQKDAIPGIVQDTSMSGATLYVEPHAIVSLNNQARVLLALERTEEEAIRRAITKRIAEVSEDLEELLAIVTILDLATARARYSTWLQANPPHFLQRGIQDEAQSAQNHHSPGQTITLRELRHPLLVWQQQHEQGPTVVPINVVIQPQIRVVAITGPNTGGKTVTLKTVGLIALMAKVGLFIPAKEPVELPWFDWILADIGDEQSLEQSLSTFSSHIRRITRIFETMTPESLVLLDEVGAGTDPTEGSALAIALLQHLASRAQLTIATTHYGELKALKYEDERFENASVEFDEATLQPTYRLLWGIPGRSNALTIARRLGLNPEVVDRAQSLVAPGGSQEVNQVIAGLEDQRRAQETKAREAEDILGETERLYREVSQKAQSLRDREWELQHSLEQAIQAAIAEAKAEIAQVIRRLQQGNVTGKDTNQATQALNEVAQRHLPSRQKPPKPKPGFKPQVGDRVRIPQIGQTGEVLSVSEGDREVTVRFGLMKMNVSMSEIESLEGEKVDMPAKKPAAASATKVSAASETLSQKPPAQAPTVRTSKNTIDLRGSRVADAEIQLEQAIAERIPVGGTLWIIHGKGTGKLREGVHQFLKQHPQIDRYELASQKEGGTGVTIAYLK